MQLFTTRRSLPWWLLVISIAFNLGFGATYGVRTYGPAARAPAGGGGPGGGMLSMIRLDEHLDLTPEQETAVERLKQELLTEIDAFRQQVREARFVLAELVIDAEFDQDAVDRQLDAISGIQRQAQRLVVDHLLQERQLLRPEQLEAFDEVVRSRVCPGYRPGDGRGQGMGNGRGAGGGGGNGKGRGAGRGQGRGG